MGRYNRYGINVKLVKRSLMLLKIMFPTVLTSAFILLLGLIVATIGGEICGYEAGLLPSKYYTVYGDHDLEGFISLTISATIIIISIALVLGVAELFSSILYVQLRGVLNEYLHYIYFNSNAYYYMNEFSDIDNPDQRITQDVERFCKLFSTIMPILAVAPFTIAYYTYKSADAAGWTAPTITYGFFLFFALINHLLMNSVSFWTFKQELGEGDFRFKHVSLRYNSESLAMLLPFAHFSQGSSELKAPSMFTMQNTPLKWEFHKTRAILWRLLYTQYRLSLSSFFLSISKNLSSYLASIWTYIAIAFVIFSAEYANVSPGAMAGHVSRLSFYLMTLFYKFTTLLATAKDMANLIGITHRIGEFIEVAERASLSMTPSRMLSSPQSCLHVIVEPYNDLYPALSLDDVTFCIPKTECVLVRNLTFSLNWGDCRLFITGPSGIGKSSLFRVFSALWPFKRGSIHMQFNRPMFLIPSGQSSGGYISAPGVSLFDILTFPLGMGENGDGKSDCCWRCCTRLCTLDSDFNHLGGPYGGGAFDSVKDMDVLMGLLGEFDLLGVVERVGGLYAQNDKDWTTILSSGEQQRLNLIRVFVQKPDVVFLDEATNQIPEETRDFFYQKLIHDLAIPFVTISHQMDLRRFHRYHLALERLNGEREEPDFEEEGAGSKSDKGNWTFSSIEA